MPCRYGGFFLSILPDSFQQAFNTGRFLLFERILFCQLVVVGCMALCRCSLLYVRLDHRVAEEKDKSLHSLSRYYAGAGRYQLSGEHAGMPATFYATPHSWQQTIASQSRGAELSRNGTLFTRPWR